jgi:hypothetical protein
MKGFGKLVVAAIYYFSLWEVWQYLSEDPQLIKSIVNPFEIKWLTEISLFIISISILITSISGPIYIFELYESFSSGKLWEKWVVSNFAKFQSKISFFHLATHGKKWKIIWSNGTAFLCYQTDDLRNCSPPPEFTANSTKESSDHNPLKTLSMTKSEYYDLVKACGWQQVAPMSIISRFSQTGRWVAAFAALGYTGMSEFGALWLGCLVFYFTHESEAEEHDLKREFKRLETTQASWQNYPTLVKQELNRRTVERKNAESQYRQNAGKQWDQFHQLLSLEGIDLQSGKRFEQTVAALYSKRGYKTKVTPAGGDYGVDVIAERENEAIAIQAKRYSKPVGVKAIQDLNYDTHKTTLTTSTRSPTER